MTGRVFAKHTGVYLFLTAFALVVLFPYFWMITCAIRDEADLFSIPPKLFAPGGSLYNFQYVLTKTRIPQYLLNSCIISVAATFMCLFASVPAGYALARFKFKARRPLPRMRSSSKTRLFTVSRMNSTTFWTSLEP